MNLQSQLQRVQTHVVTKLTSIMDIWCANYEGGCTGGKMRGDRGEEIETFVKDTIHLLGQTFQLDLMAKRGSSDKKVCRIHEKNIQKDHQVDIHVYYKQKFIAVIECKAYLDSCYYVRACDDFKLFKKFGYPVKHYIFTLENSIDEDTRIFTDYITDSVCDKIFYMLDGKRSSSKPIYDKKYRKPINQANVYDFLHTIYQLCQSVSDSESSESVSESSESAAVAAATP